MELCAGTGMSSLATARDAGCEAATQALFGLHGEPAALIVVYASPHYDLPAMLAGVRDVTHQAPLVGAASSGQFANGCYQPMGTGIAVLALSAGPYRFGIAAAEGISGDLDAVGKRLARESRDAAGPGPNGAILLFTDWVLGDLQDMINGIYRVTGPRIPTVGGAAADLLTFGHTSVFHDDRVLEHAAVAVWIASELPLTVITKHGWQPIGKPMLVSRAAGVDLLELDGRPAVTAYQEQLGLRPDALATQAEFWETAMVHSLGILEPGGALLIRGVVGKTPEGALKTAAPVPAGTAVQVTWGSTDTLLECVPSVAQEAVNAHPGARVLLAFSCSARALVFGERVAEEPRVLQDAAGAVPTFGFFTYGEFSRTRGVLGTHNATLTALAL